MAIDTVEKTVDIEELISRDVKFSEYMEGQDENQLCKLFLRRCNNNKMCGLGMFFDFLGADWSNETWSSWPRGMEEKADRYCGDVWRSFPVGQFDSTIVDQGQKAAKRFTIDWWRERGF